MSATEPRRTPEEIARHGGHNATVKLDTTTVKIIEHAAKTAGSFDPAAIQKVLENTKDFRGVYTSYSWSATERNGFPDANMAMNAASTFKDGSFKPAPR